MQNDRRAERRAERLRERRQELRREVRRDRRVNNNVARNRNRNIRVNDWERRQRQLRRQARRDYRNDLRFFDRAERINRRNRQIYYNDNRYFVVNPWVDRFGWRANAIDRFELNNGWNETVVIRPNGVRVVTIADDRGIPIRRYREVPGAAPVTLFNNLPTWWGNDSDVVIDYAPPRERYIVDQSIAAPEVVYEAVTAEPVQELDRSFTLNQVLANENVRDYMPRVDVDTITFATGSAQVADSQIDQLENIGVAIEQAVADNPNEVYLIEGHTDAVGSDLYNLELSDERASSVAEVLTEYFEIPPENLVTQGFGETYLKVDTQGASAANRRVTVRRITPLLSTDDEIAGYADDEAVGTTAQ
ncbi:OmpA family protein [Acuticoccus sp. MNP-M23]|uniref:OmpA family protein n=1 Tax=Acuticoccus sp. MNP-M23 TaxID=3072793 RepID=UPI00281527D7|nr:OmpA family protein [Acuticoccus sp. MNP-M23]WMS41073.1 OmpA family protein [Acuticoccus sp. MNP-M23]